MTGEPVLFVIVAGIASTGRAVPMFNARSNPVAITASRIVSLVRATIAR